MVFALIKCQKMFLKRYVVLKNREVRLSVVFFCFQTYLGHDNLCTNRCQNNAVCFQESPRTAPQCLCANGWSGMRCTELKVCSYYCHNGGTCSVSENMPYCQCPSGYTGLKCQLSANPTVGDGPTETADKKSVSLPVLLVAGFLMLIAGAVAGAYVLIQRRHPFSHERLQENDFNNPMYQERDTEPFTLDADKVGSSLDYRNCLPILPKLVFHLLH